MSVSISAEISRQDISGLMRQMERARKEVGKSLGQSVKFAAWSVADALRAATRISAKRREVEEMPGVEKKRGKLAWKVTGARKGKPKEWTIYAANKAEAKKHPVVQIGNRGLAQKAWHWAQSRLGSSRGGLKVGGKTFNLAQEYTGVTISLKGDDPFVKIVNRLPYASEAFESGGGQTVNNAMERAAKRMAHIIDAQIAKKMGAK